MDQGADIHANDHLEVIRYLVNQGANIHILNNKIQNKLLKQESSDKN
jgi:hypothetical protein